MASSVAYLPFGPLQSLTYGNGPALIHKHSTHSSSNHAQGRYALRFMTRVAKFRIVKGLPPRGQNVFHC